MSWDKNTISLSGLDATKRVLDNIGIWYDLSTLDTFGGRGLNDDPFMEGTDVTYELRRLHYADKVILEYVNLDADCDMDDIIFSEEYNVVNEPSSWEAIRHTDVYGDHSE